MTVRIIIKTVGYVPVPDAHPEVSYETIDIEAPELEASLKNIGSYGSKVIIGGHIIAARGGK
jgi:hypothetical protein